MRRIIHSSAFLFLGALATLQIHAQCIPDTAHCKDEGDPGQICPRMLPDAYLNEAYDEVITVIPPDTANIEGLQIRIAYIEVDSVRNLPPGIAYEANAEQFYADSAYCIQLSGAPTEAGEFPITIYVTPYIRYLTTIIKGGQIEDDTSVVITVQGASGLKTPRMEAFTLLPPVPNPFSEVVQLGFQSVSPEQLSLKVFSILGNVVYEEEMEAPAGKHQFHFDGRNLNPGTYFFRVTTTSGIQSGKFIKSR